MKRISTSCGAHEHPSRPPNDDESDASLSDASLSDGSSKRVKTAQSFESLYNSEALSDIVMDINQGQYVFHAHKMIIGLKSERLAALISSITSLNPQAPGADCVNNNSAAFFPEHIKNNGKNKCEGINSSNKHRTNEPDCVFDSKSSVSNKPVVYLHESPQCGAVFNRFLYFIYSGAVWLHRDYVLPLFQLAIKYGVGALAAHCENYVLQLLRKCLEPSVSATPGLAVDVVCDMCEEDGYRFETRQTAFNLLAKKFAELTRTERWASCKWVTVRDLLQSDDCSCDENIILVAATDWMKRNRLQDRSQILDILVSIRYPRLPRRVLYHLYTTASFKNFPQVQQLIEAAIRYHCFKEVPEAHGDFKGRQFRARFISEAKNIENTQQKSLTSHVDQGSDLDDLNHYDTLAETIQSCHSGTPDQSVSYLDRRDDSPPTLSNHIRPFCDHQPHAMTPFFQRPSASRLAHSSAIPDCPKISFHGSLVAAVSPRIQTQRCHDSPTRNTDLIDSQGSHSQM